MITFPSIPYSAIKSWKQKKIFWNKYLLFFAYFCFKIPHSALGFNRMFSKTIKKSKHYNYGGYHHLTSLNSAPLYNYSTRNMPSWSFSLHIFANRVETIILRGNSSTLPIYHHQFRTLADYGLVFLIWIVSQCIVWKLLVISSNFWAST